MSTQLQPSGFSQRLKTHIEGKSGSSADGAEKTGDAHSEGENQNSVSPYTKLNSKWIESFNVRCKNFETARGEQRNAS